eukprot:482122-Amphidinium_carterae.3
MPSTADDVGLLIGGTPSDHSGHSTWPCGYACFTLLEVSGTLKRDSAGSAILKWHEALSTELLGNSITVRSETGHVHLWRSHLRLADPEGNCCKLDGGRKGLLNEEEVALLNGAGYLDLCSLVAGVSAELCTALFNIRTSSRRATTSESSFACASDMDFSTPTPARKRAVLLARSVLKRSRGLDGWDVHLQSTVVAEQPPQPGGKGKAQPDQVTYDQGKTYMDIPYT